MRKEIKDLYELILENVHIKNHETFRNNIIDLKRLLDIECLHFFEKGWVYWQLQDHYALLRDSDNELKIFSDFVRYVKQEKEAYLPWTICDMTQALTMRLGGYNEYWDDVFFYANKLTPNNDEQVRMKFEMNRAYIGIFTDKRVLIRNELIENALQSISDIIENYPNHPDILFFQLTLITFHIKYKNFRKLSITSILKDIENHTEEINNGLKESNVDICDADYLFGSYQHIASSKNKYYAAKIGLTNILFALCEVENLDMIDYLLKCVNLYKLENKRLIGMIRTLRQWEN